MTEQECKDIYDILFHCKYVHVSKHLKLMQQYRDTEDINARHSIKEEAMKELKLAGKYHIGLLKLEKLVMWKGLES